MSARQDSALRVRRRLVQLTQYADPILVDANGTRG